ncbi:hypothetical protein C0993_012486 [Termitomyces sp. T159_Od127]|nr:hypothetical protein C0993_012486 [Termitomyces sp. T159_Od127]
MEPFSSKADRPRDALLLSLHQRELAQKDQKIQRLQHANNESLKRQWEAQQRGNALAQSLGFRDVFEAQMSIDVAGQEVSYRECLERVVTLEEEVGQLRRLNEEFKERVRTLEGAKRNSPEIETLQIENRTLLQRLDSLEALRTNENKTTATTTENTISRLEQEIKHLQDRYDGLLRVKERAAERYKLDYARWKKVKEWMFDDDGFMEENEQLDDVNDEEKKRRLKKRIKMKKRMLMEIDEGEIPTPSPFPKPPPLGGIENKENQTPPRPVPAHSQSPARRIPSLRNKILDAVAHPKPPSSSPNLFNEGFLSRSLPLKAQRPSILRNVNSDPPSSPSPRDPTAASPHSSPTVVGTASKPACNKFLNSVAQTNVPLSSPSVPNSSSFRKPLVFEPVTAVRPRKTSTHGKQESEIEQSQPSLAKQQDAVSSDTEEDVQVINVDPSPVAAPIVQPSPPQAGLTIPSIPTSPAPILSSETEPDSQSQMFSLPFFDPTPCPARPAKASLLPSQIQTAPVPAQAAFPRDRRVVSSEDEESLRARKAWRVSEDLAMTARELKSTVTSEEGKEEKGKEREEREREKKGKESDVDGELDVEVPSSTPANPPPSTAQRRIEDYSAYKGRGRYGKNAAPKDTINAQFEINPARNGGLNYKYDEVVRGKRDRKQMEAGDLLRSRRPPP